MKKIFVLMGSLLCMLTACQRGSLKPSATGAAGEVLLVMEDSVRQGQAGKTLIQLLNRDVPCMPQSEPYFNISTCQPAGFTSILRPARNIILLQVGDAYSKGKIKMTEDEWATPQAIVRIQAPTQAEAAALIGRHEDELLQFFIKEERYRAMAYQRASAEQDAMNRIETKFGFRMVVPKGTNRFKEGDDFLWMSNSSQEVRQNLVIYTYPYTEKDAFTREKLLHKRDSVMMLWIPGPAEDSYMGTQYKYDPPIFRHSMLENGQYAAEIHGLWDVKGDLMGGPFTLLACLDETKQRVVVVEAFVYAPNKYKRNTMRMLESVLYTLQLKNDTHGNAQD